MSKLLCTLLYLAIAIAANAQNSVVDLLSISKPKEQTHEKQVKTLEKWGIDTNLTFQFNGRFIDSMGTSLSYTLDTHMYRWQDFSPVQFRVYDRTGKIFTGWQYCFGALDKLGILLKDSVVDIARMPINRKLTFRQDFDLFGNNNYSLPVTPDVYLQYDYVVVAFWAPYYGRSARKMLQYIQHFVDESSAKNILFVKVSYNGTDAL